MRKSLTVLGSVLILTLGGVWVAHTAIPSADGTITACYTKPTSALRVINADTSTCKKGETKLTWNQQGVPGADGADGVSGREIVTRDVLVNSNGGRTASIDCPEGKAALSGGMNSIDPDTGVDTISGPLSLVQSSPDVNGDWSFLVENSGPIERVVRLKVVCATMAP